MTRFYSLFALPLVLTACPAVDLSAKETYSMSSDPLVVTATADAPAQDLEKFSIVIEGAPAGDYLAFVAAAPPSNASAVASFDPERDCAGTNPSCELPGVGKYAGRTTLTTVGRVDLSLTAIDSHLIFVRRGSEIAEPINVVVTVSSRGGDGGCSGDAEPPTLTRVSP